VIHSLENYQCTVLLSKTSSTLLMTLIRELAKTKTWETVRACEIGYEIGKVGHLHFCTPNSAAAATTRQQQQAAIGDK